MLSYFLFENRKLAEMKKYRKHIYFFFGAQHVPYKGSHEVPIFTLLDKSGRQSRPRQPFVSVIRETTGLALDLYALKQSGKSRGGSFLDELFALKTLGSTVDAVYPWELVLA